MKEKNRIYVFVGQWCVYLHECKWERERDFSGSSIRCIIRKYWEPLGAFAGHTYNNIRNPWVKKDAEEENPFPFNIGLAAREYRRDLKLSLII